MNKNIKAIGMRHIFLIALCISTSIGVDYPLKKIAQELLQNSTAQKSFAPSSIKLLQTAKGIVYPEKLPPDFLHKMKEKKNLVIRIFGDSHIAGDFISHRLRTLLFNSYTLGFVYPIYPPYHQHIALKYESQNYEVLNSRTNDLDEYPLGGVVAKPLSLPAIITLTPQANANLHQATSTIFFKSPNKEGVLLVEDSNMQRFVINAKRPFVWQSVSLSLRYPITLKALNEKVLLGGFLIHNQNGENNIIENLGINGARSDIWRKWDKDLFSKELSILPADLFILCYGSNDALNDNFNETNFLRSYSELIDTIRAVNPKTQILLIAPPPVVQKVSNATRRKKAVYKTSKNAKAVKIAIHKLAKEKRTLLFDMEDFINQSGGKKKWESALLAKPDVHLLPAGYKLIADKLYYDLSKLKGMP